jgi:RNA polymerase sigma-70 factor (ECF subfamily)
LTNNVYLSFAEQYEKIESIENWLRRVLFLTFVKWYKQSKLKHTVEISEYIAADDDYLKTENSFDVSAILEVVDKLSKDKQDIIKMRFWEELKFSEIAEKLGKSEDAIKKMFYRTIEEIKKLLD